MVMGARVEKGSHVLKLIVNNSALPGSSLRLALTAMLSLNWASFQKPRGEALFSSGNQFSKLGFLGLKNKL